MRLAIIADVHGNYRALEAVLADIDRMGAERIVSLGDNIGYGPEPEEVVQALCSRQIVSVMGNHELGLVSQSYWNRLHGTAQQSLAITRTRLTPESLAWLAELPVVHLAGETRFVHGCPPESATVYLHEPSHNRLRRLFAGYPEQLCFAGHTHDLGWHQQQDEAIASCALGVEEKTLAPDTRYLLLPGSVGQPRDSLSWHAKYMLWDQARNTIAVRSVAYDVQTTIRLLNERGFPASNAKRLFW